MLASATESVINVIEDLTGDGPGQLTGRVTVGLLGMWEMGWLVDMTRLLGSTMVSMGRLETTLVVRVVTILKGTELVRMVAAGMAETTGRLEVGLLELLPVLICMVVVVLLGWVVAELTGL